MLEADDVAFVGFTGFHKIWRGWWGQKSNTIGPELYIFSWNTTQI